MAVTGLWQNKKGRPKTPFSNYITDDTKFTVVQLQFEAQF